MLTLLLSAALAQASDPLYEPRQVHLALGNSPDSMIVSWSADRPAEQPAVQYCLIDGPQVQANSTYDLETEAQWKVLNYTITRPLEDRVLYYAWGELQGLEYGRYYQYRVGSEATGWSDAYYFRAPRDYEDTDPYNFIIYGDLGVGDKARKTVDTLMTEINTQTYEAIVHLGDFAYSLDSLSGQRGDEFMTQIEDVAAYVPYMVVQGNHEKPLHYNQAELQVRFTMPGDSQNLWYSFSVRNAYFIVFTVEQIMYDFMEPHAKMMEFLVNELNSIDRDKYSWVIGLMHRPMYCSAEMNKRHQRTWGYFRRSNADCLKSAPRVREVFEDLLFEHKVDLVLTGHVHAYERLAPAYQNRTMGCSEQSKNLCVNPKAPTTIVTGNSGQKISIAPVSSTPLPWSIVQSQEIGYGRVTVFNATHLLWEQVKSSDRSRVDHLWMVKTNQ